MEDAAAVTYRTVVSPEVERVLGSQVIRAWATVIESRTLPCIFCPDPIEPTRGDPVTLSVAFLGPDPGERRPSFEVLLAHGRCGTSRIIVPPDDQSDVLSAGPPAIAMVKHQSTRAVLLTGFYAPKLGTPVGTRDTVDAYLRPMMGLGLQLVLGPYEEFETPVATWSVTLTDHQTIELRGPAPLALQSACPEPLPAWVDAIIEQGRCLVLLTTLMAGDGYITGQGDPAQEVQAAIDGARRDGRLLGGVVPATVAPAAAVPVTEVPAVAVTARPVVPDPNPGWSWRRRLQR